MGGPCEVVEEWTKRRKDRRRQEREIAMRQLVCRGGVWKGRVLVKEAGEQRLEKSPVGLVTMAWTKVMEAVRGTEDNYSFVDGGSASCVRSKSMSVCSGRGEP